MSSNFPPGYSEDGDAASHGSETAIYQELVDLRKKFDKWKVSNRRDFPNDEFTNKVIQIEAIIEEMEDELDQSL